MKGIFNKRAVFAMIIVLVMFSAFIALHIMLLSVESKGKENAIGLFKVLSSSDESKLSYERIVNATTTIMQSIFSGNIRCDYGKVSLIKQDNVLYVYLGVLDKIKISPDIEMNRRCKYKPMRNETPIGIIVNETGSYSIPFFSGDYVKVYSKVYSFETIIPENTRQGLIKAFKDNHDEYYLILNIPYIYFKARYREGVGNASLIIRMVFNINGVNLSNPFIVEYYLNTDTKVFLSPMESPYSKKFIEKNIEALNPLLYIDGGNKVELKYYVEVFVRSSGKCRLELVIGYPGVRIIELR